MILCFCHMIKTAGTTLHYIFRNNFGFNYVEINKKNFAPVDLKKLLRINKNIRAIGGHSLRSVAKLDSVCPDLKYITFFRDPIDRFLSHYNHGRNSNYHQMSLEERINIPGEANYQTKFIIGAKDIEEREVIIGLNELENAKRILVKDFIFVGLLEEFDGSLILMKEILNFPNFDICYERMNVARKKFFTRDKVSNHLLNKLREANKIDFELYRFVKNELFEKYKYKYGSDFIEALNNFKLSNKNYSFKKSQILMYRLGKYLIYYPMLRLK